MSTEYTNRLLRDALESLNNHEVEIEQKIKEYEMDLEDAQRALVKTRLQTADIISALATLDQS